MQPIVPAELGADAGAAPRTVGEADMRILLPVLAAFIAWTAVGAAGQAGSIRRVDLPNESRPGILLSGVIVPGDEATFHALAATLGDALVITTGPGGSVGPALAIGSETRARGWSTLVPEGTRCASACSMIWLAGQTRMLASGAEIGFHAMSTIQDGKRTETHEVDILLRRWLTDLGYALDATATIVNTRAASIRWYDAIELRANGISTDPYP
jgi:hypothetical protein